MSERFFSLLAIVSLVSTAYIMRKSPLHPDRKGKKPMSAEDERLANMRSMLVPTNGVVCLVLALAYLLASRASSAIHPLLYLIPGGRFLWFFYFYLCSSLSRTGQRACLLTIDFTAMLAMILLVRDVMLSVDLTTLKDLQYEYKGA